MKDRNIVDIVIASSFGGFVYWLIKLGHYIIYHLINNNLIPLDAIVILFIVIVFSWIAGLIFCLPIYYYLNKNKIDNIYTILFLSILVSIVFVNSITGEWGYIYSYLESGFIGLLSGLVFYQLTKEKNYT